MKKKTKNKKKYIFAKDETRRNTKRLSETNQNFSLIKTVFLCHVHIFVDIESC